MLEAGKGCPCNQQEAFQWYKKKGITRTSARALQRLEEKAIKDNNSQAQYLLGKHYLQHKQDSTTIERGLSWCEQAAFNNYLEAINTLEEWYVEQKSTNYIKLFLFYDTLSKQGYGRAYYKAAELLTCGHIYPLNYPHAILKTYEQAKGYYQEALKAKKWWTGETHNAEIEAVKSCLLEVSSILEELKLLKIPEFNNRLYTQIQSKLVDSQQQYLPYIFYWVGVLADIVRLRYTDELQTTFCTLIVPLMQHHFLQDQQKIRLCFKELFTLFKTSSFTERQWDPSAEPQRIELLETLMKKTYNKDNIILTKI